MIIRYKNKMSEAQGDSKDLVSMNMDFLKKNNPNTSNLNPKDYYQSLNQKAFLGVEERFSKTILDFIEQLPAQYLPKEGKKYFIKWLANELKKMDKTPSNEDIRKIKDFFLANNTKPLPDDFEAAIKASDDWHAELGKTAGNTVGEYKTNDVIHDFGNGYKIVRIASTSGKKEDVKFDLELEGKKMGNCVGTIHCPVILSSEETIFSLRDSNNEPHVTINQYNENYRGGSDNDYYDDYDEYNDEYKAGKIDEIKGKQNKLPLPIYEDMVFPWIINNFPVEVYFEAEGGIVTKHKSFDKKAKEIVDNFDSSKRLGTNTELFSNVIEKSSDENILRRAYDKLKDKREMYYLFQNPNLPSDIIKDVYPYLKKQKDQPLLRRLIYLKNTPSEILQDMFIDFEKQLKSLDLDSSEGMLISYTLEEYIKNPNTPNEVINKIISHVSPDDKPSSSFAAAIIDAYGNGKVEKNIFDNWINKFTSKFKTKATLKKYKNLIDAAEEKRNLNPEQELKENKIFNRLCLLAGIRRGINNGNS